MPYHSFSHKIGFSMKEAKKYGEFIFPIRNLKSEIKQACYGVLEGCLSCGTDNMHYNWTELILRDLVDMGVFLPNEYGRCELPKKQK